MHLHSKPWSLKKMCAPSKFKRIFMKFFQEKRKVGHPSVQASADDTADIPHLNKMSHESDFLSLTKSATSRDTHLILMADLLPCNPTTCGEAFSLEKSDTDSKSVVHSFARYFPGKFNASFTSVKSKISGVCLRREYVKGGMTATSDVSVLVLQSGPRAMVCSVVATVHVVSLPFSVVDISEVRRIVLSLLCAFLEAAWYQGCNILPNANAVGWVFQHLFRWCQASPCFGAICSDESPLKAICFPVPVKETRFLDAEFSSYLYEGQSWMPPNKPLLQPLGEKKRFDRADKMYRKKHDRKKSGRRLQRRKKQQAKGKSQGVHPQPVSEKKTSTSIATYPLETPTGSSYTSRQSDQGSQGEDKKTSSNTSGSFSASQNCGKTSTGACGGTGGGPPPGGDRNKRFPDDGDAEEKNDDEEDTDSSEDEMEEEEDGVQTKCVIPPSAHNKSCIRKFFTDDPVVQTEFVLERAREQHQGARPKRRNACNFTGGDAKREGDQSRMKKKEASSRTTRTSGTSSMSFFDRQFNFYARDNLCRAISVEKDPEKMAALFQEWASLDFEDDEEG